MREPTGLASLSTSSAAWWQCLYKPGGVGPAMRGPARRTQAEAEADAEAARKNGGSAEVAYFYPTVNGD